MSPFRVQTHTSTSGRTLEVKGMDIPTFKEDKGDCKRKSILRTEVV
jgi:hypothetical protein